jgi:hypothetical protein
VFELREPKFRWGQRVAATIDLFNDGSHPEVPLDALLVAEGAAGEVVQKPTFRSTWSCSPTVRAASMARRVPA